MIVEDSMNQIRQEPEGLSEYSRQLAADTEVVLNRMFPAGPKGQTDKQEETFQVLNRQFVRNCLIFLLSQMTSEERQAFMGQSQDIRSILDIAAQRVGLGSGSSSELTISLTNSAGGSDFAIANSLGLLNPHSPAKVLEREVLRALERNPQASEALAYLRFQQN